MHSSRMRTTHSSLYQGVSIWGSLFSGSYFLCSTETPPRQSPQQREPPTSMVKSGLECIILECILVHNDFFLCLGVSVQEVPLDRDSLDRDSLDRGPLDRDPMEGTCDQAARQEVTSYRDPSPVNRIESIIYYQSTLIFFRTILVQTSVKNFKLRESQGLHQRA